ncbi:MAG TPA: response regulator transcription factor [Candidatus Mailhella excrementigallinarum]|nr:response regulator transcription factor [Candidatus Mailhella excrementigallinarum]
MIYVLEDDRNIRDLVVYSLNSVGLNARGFELPSEFRKAVENELPELVLLDIMLPEEDGVAVLRRLRGREVTRDIPVIMLTALGDEFDKVRGLDAGADDYVSKPFGMMELLARVRARLRRRSEPVPLLSRMGPLELDRERHEVRVNGSPVALTRKEYELLRLLMDHPRAAFDRDQLLERVWGYDYAGETRTVDVHVRTLRQKLGEAASCIETVRGVGYRLAAEWSPGGLRMALPRNRNGQTQIRPAAGRLERKE